MVSDGAEPSFALYSSLILHFGCFRKRANNWENNIKSINKSIQNRCRIDARKSDAKIIAQIWKTEPKWKPKSIIKKTMEKSMRKKEDFRHGAELAVPAKGLRPW